MKNKVRNVLAALVLCMSAVALPVTAYASTGSDTTPPTLTAALKDDKLAVEASDDMSGVEAVYVDGGPRINSLVNGKGTVALKDYAGDDKEVTVYAVDYSGNRSKEVKLDNPYYEEPAQTQAASSAAPNLQWGNTGSAFPNARAFSFIKQCFRQFGKQPGHPDPFGLPGRSRGFSESSATEDETESAVPEGAFTSEGTGTVLDSATGQEDDKQFYTITTADGNVFYLIIDGKRDSENVYFLNGVTEEDLLSLAQQDNGSESAIEVVTCNCTEKCEAGAVNYRLPGLQK